MPITFALLALPFLLQGGAAPPTGTTPVDIVEGAGAADWVAIPQSDLLVMDLAPDRDGAARRVVIQLLPAPYSTGWIGNIRRLAAARWWDGTSVNRVQDNYVAQWGDATEKKPLPPGLARIPEGAYETSFAKLPATARAARETRRTARIDGRDVVLPVDTYAAGILFDRGWPIATGGGEGAAPRSAWPVHCYGMVGVGRDVSPDTGTGAELYAVIGHAPRHLDRNIALVGRVIAGIEHLSSLPRGTGALGFYERAEQRVAITSVRLGSDLPAAERPRYQYLRTEGDVWRRYEAARANRKDSFFIRPVGTADVCNIPVLIRAAK